MMFHASGNAGGVRCFGGTRPWPLFVWPGASVHRFGFSLTHPNYVCLVSRWFRSSCVFTMLYDFITTNLHPKKKGQATARFLHPGHIIWGAGRAVAPTLTIPRTRVTLVLGSSISSRYALLESLDMFQTSATGILLRRKS